MPQFVIATLMVGVDIFYVSVWENILVTHLTRKFYCMLERVLNTGWKDVQIYTGLAIWPWKQMTANSQKLFISEKQNNKYEIGWKTWETPQSAMDLVL